MLRLVGMLEEVLRIGERRPRSVVSRHGDVLCDSLAEYAQACRDAMVVATGPFLRFMNLWFLYLTMKCVYMTCVLHYQMMICYVIV